MVVANFSEHLQLGFECKSISLLLYTLYNCGGDIKLQVSFTRLDSWI